jgi:hypothetical protein
MKFEVKTPPRIFEVGAHNEITIADCADLDLEPNEQVTFKTASGAEYDVTRKEWGYYATPSTNGRLKRFGWRTALVKNPREQYFVFLMESGKQAEFDAYLKDQGLSVVKWLDDDKELATL